MSRTDLYAEIQDTLGLVPIFLKSLPDSDLEWEWRLLKRVQMADGPIPGKFRHLIGLGLAGAVRCDHGVVFHTEFAKVHGATDLDIEFIARFVKNSVGWSSYLKGLQVDLELFKKDVIQSSEHIRSVLAKKTVVSITGEELTLSRDGIYKEMERIFGLVPTLFKYIPDSSLGLEWVILKGHMFGEGPVPLKYAHLAGLAVGAYTGCPYSIFYHTELAKLCGASKDEIEDAVHLVKSGSGWSAYVNCLRVDLDLFRDEIVRIADFVRSQLVVGVRETELARR